MQGQLEEQLQQLSRKVEDLERLIERFRAELLHSLELMQQGLPLHPMPSGYLGNLSEHRDILTESIPQPHTTPDHQDLPLEMQIQRLMAQLTAAYSRIATLEEQLVACRLQQK
ncbi:MAG: hypothetical protein RMI89_11045 [Gloeomargarita sp. SKYBB_i_bin120]|nr:hypothetical protein [Gloeomargarita sp. SKYG98]MCS7293487.1 hypothetical protein [Gloeomargarita sp. SKYB120]MDW8179053.1 hypothetical protein [Gloeomargarita sp. SKYBB_i_bin120]